MEVVIPQAPELWNGYFPHLEITKEAAITYGNSVFVLEPFPCPAVDEFRKHYRHNGPNSKWFQQWTFEQWLYLAEWMRQTNREVVFKIDSDTLIFTNLERLWHDAGKPPITTWVPDTFITASMAMEVSDYIVETYRIGQELERQKPRDHASDQSIIGTFIRNMGTVALCSIRDREMLDDSLYQTHSETIHESHKDVWFVQGQPCWIRANGYIRLLTLHCWGAAKKKIDVIWTQSRQSIGGHPVRLNLG